MVGGREIGSGLFNDGGALGLDVVPSDMRSVLILGGRRGPDIPGRSHNVCLLSTSRAADVVCGSSRGWVGRGEDGSADCVVDGAEVKVCAGMGWSPLGGELFGGGGTGGEGFRGKNNGALGFSGALEGKGAVSESGSMTVFGGKRVDEASDFVTGGGSCTDGTGGKTEGGVGEDANPFEFWGCSTDSGDSFEREGVELGAGCANTEEL